MNILIPYAELKKYLSIAIDAQECMRCLTLSGPSVERIVPYKDGDEVFDIEITTNRIDTACVLGIAQEAAAILPRFAHKVSWKRNVLASYQKETLPDKKMLDISVENGLCTRLIALVMEVDPSKKTPPELSSVLEKAGMRSINPVVDISNYIRLVLGQPVHMFDYDLVKDGSMKIRTSKKGEKITLLDGRSYELPGDDIVIEDKNGALIDLAGIMGGKNSEVCPTTKRIIFFVPTFDKLHIRRTSMRTGARSDSSSYYEKGVDSERAEPAFWFGLSLLKQYAGGNVLSQRFDYYPKGPKAATIVVTGAYIRDRIGEDIATKEMVAILASLGFAGSAQGDDLFVTVPFWRATDVQEKADLVEEVARIYGYHRIGSTLSPLVLVNDAEIQQHDARYRTTRRIKDYLSHTGAYEVYTYSMYGLADLERIGLTPEDHLAITNPLSTELQYMRRSLLPSLYRVRTVSSQIDNLTLFECAHVYEPQQEGKLPKEIAMLGILSTRSFAEVKGMGENICTLLHISQYSFVPLSDTAWGTPRVSFQLGNRVIGEVGIFSDGLAYAHIELTPLLAAADTTPLLNALKGTPVIEDITYAYQEAHPWPELVSYLTKQYRELDRIEYRGTYRSGQGPASITMRLYSYPKAGTSILPDVVKDLESHFSLRLKR